MENPSKLEKLKILGLESSLVLPDEYVDSLYKLFKDNPIKNINNCQEVIKNKIDHEVIVKQSKNYIDTQNRVDSSNPRYQILLKFINCILTNLNKSSIIKLTEFIDIDRQDIIKPINNDSFEKMEDEIFKYFDKMKAGWYRRKTTKGYVLSFLRYACRDIGYDFSYIQKNRQKKGDIKSHLFYSIK